MDDAAHKIWNATLAIMKKIQGENSTESIPINIQPIDIPKQLSAISQTDMFYLEVYFGLAGLNLLFTILRAFLFAYGGVLAAKRIHKLLLKIVVKVRILLLLMLFTVYTHQRT